jgi:hypothetical protein
VETLRETIKSIVSQPHGPIYISCDGPKDGFAESAKPLYSYISGLAKLGIVQEYRISNVNLGTLHGVSEGIDWFFQKVEIGIILEDDLLLEDGLLESLELIKKFLRNKEIISIGLANSVPDNELDYIEAPFRKSKFVVSWGWITTRQNWTQRITSFQNLNYFLLFLKILRHFGPSTAFYHLYFYLMNAARENKDSRNCNWDDLWQINCFLKNKFVIALNRNMITNIGNGFGATHTSGKNLYYPIKSISNVELEFMRESEKLPNWDRKADKYFCKNRKIVKIIRAQLNLQSKFGFRL